MPRRSKTNDSQTTLDLFSAPAQHWQAVLPLSIQPSVYQQQIFEQMLNGQGDLIINAVAGSGKTWTIVQSTRILYLTPRHDFSIMLASFNVHIKETLKKKLAGTTASISTIHGLGYHCLKKTLGNLIKRADADKYSRISRHELERWHTDQLARGVAPPNAREMRETAHTIEHILSLVRLTLTDLNSPNGLNDLLKHYGLSLPTHYVPLLAQILAIGNQALVEHGVHDFTDMLYGPHLLDIIPPQSDFIFVDECQDLSPAQLALILKCRKPGGRMIFVGDANQSIMGFSGADSDSFWRIQEITQATELPLSICYRCPTSHLELARRLVPEIQGRPDAPAGILETLPEAQLPELVKAGDLILCRITAPLISWCIKLIGLKIHARIRGVELAEEINRIIQRISQRSGFHYRDFPQALSSYLSEQTEYLQNYQNNDGLISALTDKCAAILSCYEAFRQETHTADELCQKILGLFSDEQAPVWLSTVHRAKGLENPSVFILAPDKLPMRWKGQQSWEWQQELNLRYVALTRATERLVILQPQGMSVDYQNDYIDPVMKEMAADEEKGEKDTLFSPIAVNLPLEPIAD